MDYENANQTEELDLKSILETLKRGKLYLLLITLLSSLFGSIYAFRATPIWLGSFNIVVSEANNNTTQQQIINIPGLVNNKSETKTEKLILKSPSVLMPVYEYIKNYYSKNGQDTSSMTFKSWIKNDIAIDFKDGSNVLSVEFKNKDKELIISTLNLVKKRYQDYSRRDQEKNIREALDYLRKQEKIMSKKSLMSKKEFNKFSIDNGLGNIDGFVNIDNQFDIQLRSSNPEQNINFLDNLSQKLNFPKEKQANAGQRYKNLFSKLEAYELLYTDLSAKLKPNSSYLKDLQIKKENLEKALKRPNEILLKYQELKSNAERNAYLLVNIQNNLELVKLEQIKTPNAWELISTPSIEKNKVYPNEKRIIFMSLFLSSLIGSIFILIKEKLSGVLFNKKSLIKNINCAYLETLEESEPTLNIQIINNLYESSCTDKNSKLGIINKSKNKNLLKSISDNSNVIEVNFSDKKMIDNCYKLVLIFESGNINQTELGLLNKYIKLYDKKVIGWILLDVKGN
mgnify:CR=1 FL=1